MRELALALGMPVKRLLAEHSSAELSEWLAFQRVYPFGTSWENLKWAQWMALTANIHRDAKRRAEPYEPEDFLPGGRTREQSVEEQIELMRMYTGQG